jgi:hypothetical protein
MKNFRYVGILLVFVIMAAVFVAGCTSSSSPGATATPAATGTTTGTATPAATTTSSSGTPSSLGSAFDMGKVHMFEYKTTTPAGTGTEKFETGVTYNGQTADKMTTTSTMTQDSNTIDSLIEIYTANDKTLGGHMQSKMNGNVISDTPIQASEASSGTSDPSGKYGSSTLTSATIDPVTVPAGVYATATKYTITDATGAIGSVWIASGVPVPVKYVVGTGDSTVTMELDSWN